MKKTMFAAALAAAAMAAGPAWAASSDGRLEIKLLGTGVLPDGKITRVDKDLIGLPAASQTRANDNVVPTVAIEYYASPNVSVETICCLTQHGVSGAGGLAGASVIDHVQILPATLTLKYHFGEAGGIQPYVGAGPSLFLYFGEKPGASVQGLGVASVKLDNKLGVALQAGVDVPITDTGMGISLDAKKYFMDTTAHFITAGGTEALTTRHSLDPWVLSGGVFVRF